MVGCLMLFVVFFFSKYWQSPNLSSLKPRFQNVWNLYNENTAEQTLCRHSSAVQVSRFIERKAEMFFLLFKLKSIIYSLVSSTEKYQ